MGPSGPLGPLGPSGPLSPNLGKDYSRLIKPRSLHILHSSNRFSNAPCLDPPQETLTLEMSATLLPGPQVGDLLGADVAGWENPMDPNTV